MVEIQVWLCRACVRSIRVTVYSPRRSSSDDVLNGACINSERAGVSVMELKTSVDPSGEFCSFSLYGRFFATPP